MKVGAVVLAAGCGKRMNSDVAKQYMEIGGKPLMVYCLKTFELSTVDDVVLVVSPGDVDYVKKEIVEKYGLKKVSSIIEGGAERYNSVYEGLKAIECDYVLIHDAARPFVSLDIISRCIEQVKKSGSCVVGTPVKDTIKVVGPGNRIKNTPDRSTLWAVQTPQAFYYELVFGAYVQISALEDPSFTDDAQVVEKLMAFPVSVIEGDYENIKITTPEDVVLAEAILKSRSI